VAQSLSRAGLISSQRGRHGGSVLAVSPEDLSVLTVLEVEGPLQRIHSCPLGIKSPGTSLCALHQRLDDAMALVEKAFKDSTIADLIAEKRSSRPCAKPAARKIAKRPNRSRSRSAESTRESNAEHSWH